MIAYLALGSSLGDRLAYLAGAVRALDALPDVRVAARSTVYETPPVGGAAQNAFLNAVIRVQTDLSPFALLAECRHVEDAAGRKRDERWADRTLDIDLLLYGDAIVEEPGLSIPHPRLSERAFVLVPLADLAPDLVLPVTGRTVREALAALATPSFRPVAWPDGDPRVKPT